MLLNSRIERWILIACHLRETNFQTPRSPSRALGPVLSPAISRAAVWRRRRARSSGCGGGGGARENRSKIGHTETGIAVKIQNENDDDDDDWFTTLAYYIVRIYIFIYKKML